MKSNSVTVRRITVDEILDENLIRILISELRENVKPGKLENDTVWGDEVPLLVTNRQFKDSNHEYVRNDNWSALLTSWGIPERIRPRWDNLYEGQVYLQGAYSLKKDKDKIILSIDPSKRWIVRIDLVPQIKDHRDRLYNKNFLRRARLA